MNKREQKLTYQEREALRVSLREFFTYAKTNFPKIVEKFNALQKASEEGSISTEYPPTAIVAPVGAITWNGNLLQDISLDGPLSDSAMLEDFDQESEASTSQHRQQHR